WSTPTSIEASPADCTVPQLRWARWTKISGLHTRLTGSPSGAWQCHGSSVLLNTSFNENEPLVNTRAQGGEPALVLFCINRSPLKALLLVSRLICLCVQKNNEKTVAHYLDSDCARSRHCLRR